MARLVSRWAARKRRTRRSVCSASSLPSSSLCLASVAVDLRVAQVVDKPQASMEAYLPLDIFTGEAKAKMMAAVGM